MRHFYIQSGKTGLDLKLWRQLKLKNPENEASSTDYNLNYSYSYCIEKFDRHFNDVYYLCLFIYYFSFKFKY